MIARFGGEEFVVADIYRTEDLHDIAEQLRKAIAATPYPITASVGIVSVPLGPSFDPAERELIDDLVNVADTAMYAAKAPAETRAAPPTSRTPPSEGVPLKVVADVDPVDVIQVCHLDENSANVYVKDPRSWPPRTKGHHPMTTTQKPEMTDAFVLGGVRTPFARYGSSLSHIRVDDLLGMAMKGACERVGVSLDQIEDIIAGCVNPAHEGMGDIARWSALAAGFPDSVAGTTINRFCASSLSATITVAHAIKAGDLGVGIACGVESMSRSGWAYMKGDAPFSPRGPVVLLDTMWAGAGGPPHPALLARNAYISMIETAQNVADRYGLTREEIDAFALRSQRHAKAARDSGRLAKEIMPVQISATKKDTGTHLRA